MARSLPTAAFESLDPLVLLKEIKKFAVLLKARFFAYSTVTLFPYGFSMYSVY